MHVKAARRSLPSRQNSDRFTPGFLYPEGHHAIFRGFLLGVRVACLLLVLVRRLPRRLRLDHVDEFLEVLRHDRAVGARAHDVNDVLLVDLVLLYQLGSSARDLALRGVVVRVGLGGRLQVLDVLEQNLAIGTRALDLSDVQPVVAAELLRAWRGVHLGLLGALSELLEVLDRDLVVGSGALEPVGDDQGLSVSKVLRRLAGEAGERVCAEVAIGWVVSS